MNYNQQREALHMNAPEQISERRLRVLYVATDRLLVAADKIIQTEPVTNPAPSVQRPVAEVPGAEAYQNPLAPQQQPVVSTAPDIGIDRIAEAQRQLSELYGDAA